MGAGGAGGMDRAFTVLSLEARGRGEFDDQDGVLAGETITREADLGEDVVVPAGEPDAAIAENNVIGTIRMIARAGDALILRGEHQKDEAGRRRKDEQRGVAGEDLLIGSARPFKLIPWARMGQDSWMLLCFGR